LLIPCAGLAACDLDEILVDPATAGERASIVFAVDAVASGGVLAASDPDRAWVYVERANGEPVLDTVAVIAPGASEARVAFEIEVLQKGEPLTLTVELREGTLPVARGYGSVLADPDVRTTATVDAAPIGRTISAGYEHTCAIRPSGQAACWGRNAFGERGDGGGFIATSPQPVAGGLAFASLAVAGEFSCGVTTDGAGYCWGANFSGRLGDGSFDSSPTPVQVGGGQAWRAIRTGNAHACGLTTGGDVYCWGANYAGQLGQGTTGGGDSNVPVPVTLPGDVRDIETGFSHSCALLLDGDAYCWGDNTGGRLGDGTQTTTGTPRKLVSTVPFLDLVLGSGNNCALDYSGTAWCWGDNFVGALGDGTFTPRPTPGPVAGGLRFLSLAIGAYHVCGVVVGGDAYCWGGNFHLQLGNGSFAHLALPERVALSRPAVEITGAGVHTCALDIDGAAWCWGLPDFGRLGDGTSGFVTAPATLSGTSGFGSVAASLTNGCALQNTVAWCWGETWALGSPQPGQFRTTAAPIPGAAFTAITAGASFACGLSPGGAAFCWGSDVDGRSGNGAQLGSFNVPFAVAGNRTWASIDGAFDHACAVEAGTLAAWCWGRGVEGQLGNGGYDSEEEPVRVSGGLQFTTVATGSGHSCGVTTAGEAWCWGRASAGQLGNGGFIPSNVPVRVSSSETFTDIALGFEHSCGITAAGPTLCWGGNFWGNLGDGSSSSSSTPVPVTGGHAFPHPVRRREHHLRDRRERCGLLLGREHERSTRQRLPRPSTSSHARAGSGRPVRRDRSGTAACLRDHHFRRDPVLGLGGFRPSRQR
jgi:alpha-tubulin suppressor-like RCC1 family protein